MARDCYLLCGTVAIFQTEYLTNNNKLYTLTAVAAEKYNKNVMNDKTIH